MRMDKQERKEMGILPLLKFPDKLYTNVNFCYTIWAKYLLFVQLGAAGR